MNLNTRRSGCPHPDNNQHKMKVGYPQKYIDNIYIMNNRVCLYANLCRGEDTPTYGDFYA